MTTILTIPEKVPSNNNGLLNMHFAKKSKMIGSWIWLFKAQTQNRHTGSVSIHLIHYYRGNPIRDYDNLSSTCKLIFDAIVRAEIIVDDNLEITGIPKFTQERVKEKKDVKTIVFIQDRLPEIPLIDNDPNKECPF